MFLRGKRVTITAKIIADSISEQGVRLTTMQLRYPKFIHGEAKTHRALRVGDKAYEFLEEVGFMDDPAFSRNASSSRAIPVERMIRDVLEDPVIPLFWGRNQPGMQANEECDAMIPWECAETYHSGGDDDGDEAIGACFEPVDRVEAWLMARNNAVDCARAFARAGYHKQIVNRLLEPWAHINVVVTATDWANFFALRRHADAQPEMKVLADTMWFARDGSKPSLLRPGQWHLPYCDDVQGKYRTAPNDDAIKVSVARCARVSYLTQDGKPPSIVEDLKLYARLIGATPLHASPAEHQATPDEWLPNYNFGEGCWHQPDQHGNLTGWLQLRKQLAGECVKELHHG